ncbi:MAG: protein BatD [Verrucomicrobia bacterium]|nr:MAG: protein BatD [Verrucomicrobiota bacterium]
MVRRFLGWLLFAAAACGAGQRLAAAAEVQVLADRSSIEFGETVGVQIVIPGSQNAPAPALPNLPGVRMRYLGLSSHMEMNNGQTFVFSKHRYIFKPDTTNDLVIPSFPLRIGNQTLRSTPLRIAVLPAETHQEPAWLKLIVPEGQRVVGESFPVELQLYYQAIRDPEAPRFNLDGFLLGRGQQPVQAATARDNETWSIVTWRFAATATKAGTLSVGPAEMDVTLVMGRSARNGSVLDEFFGGGREMKRVTLKSKGVSIAVVAPPRPGPPPGFAGAVGRFALAGTVTPQDAMVGDPVTLNLVVSGKGNLERLELGPIPDSADFRAYPGTNRFEPTDALGFEGRKVFEYVLVPEQAGMLRLPVPPLVFYDPERKTYATSTPPALTLRVRGQALAQALPAVAGPAGGDSAKAASAGMPVWKSGRSKGPWAGAGWGTRPWVAAVALVPWMGWAAVGAGGWILRRRRAAAARTPEQLRTLELARLRAGLLGPDAGMDAAVRAVRLAVGLRLDAIPDAVAIDVVERGVARGELDADLGDDIRGFFEAVDGCRFGGGRGTEPGGMARTAADLVDRLAGGSR